MRDKIIETLQASSNYRGAQWIPYINGKPIFFGGVKSFKSDGIAVARMVRACRHVREDGQYIGAKKAKQEILKLIQEGVITIKRVV